MGKNTYQDTPEGLCLLERSAILWAVVISWQQLAWEGPWQELAEEGLIDT